MYRGLHVQYLILLSHFNETWIFLYIFKKILKYQISWKSVQWSWVVPYGRMDSQTDMTKLTVTFCNFVNAPKNWFTIQQHDWSYFNTTQCQNSLEHENFCHLYSKYIYIYKVITRHIKWKVASLPWYKITASPSTNRNLPVLTKSNIIFWILSRSGSTVLLLWARATGNTAERHCVTGYGSTVRR